ncbi:MAG: phospholipase D-like domain-containing protein [Cyclonatronaceae bacterium]
MTFLRYFFTHLPAAFVLLLVPVCPLVAQPAADSSSVEFIEVYFNMPADTSIATAPENRARHSQDLISTLVRLIDAARHSVDVAIYDFQHHRVGEALVRARQCGLRVRVITDNENRNAHDVYHPEMWQRLAEGDIITMDDSGTVYWPDGRIERHELTGASAFMHHKFAVIDALSPSPEDDFTWAATMNLTYTGPFNTNQATILKDSGIARAFQEEFEMMWGSRTAEPNPQRARFHRDKRNVSQNLFWVNDTRVELYFSPMDRNRSRPSISERVVELLENETDHDIAFLAFAITPSVPISQAIWALSADPEIRLNGVIDRMFFGRYRNQGDIWASPEARTLGRSVLPGRELRKLHAKTLLIDAQHPGRDDTAITITGSYNFSSAAENANDEYILIIHDDAITNQFMQDVMGVKARARGEAETPVPPVDPQLWYPVAGVQDGQVLEVELSRNLRFPVSLLGVRAPRMFAGADSAHYYAGAAKAFAEELAGGAEVRLQGPYGSVPDHNYGRYYAYVELRDSRGRRLSLNRRMLEEGMAEYSRFYRQHPDSAALYQQLEETARRNALNYWREPQRIGQRVPRYEEDESLSEAPAFPININQATARELEALPNIGPARAAAIIAYREENGGISSVDELQNIRGIGPVTVAEMRPLVVF